VSALEVVRHTRRDTFRRIRRSGATLMISTDLLTFNLLAEVVAKQSKKG
jgi:imidazolonepropionase-like amidohydrolase